MYVRVRSRVTVRDRAAEAAVRQRAREWRAQQRAGRRAEQTTPMPVAVWVAFGVLCLVAVVTGNVAAAPGLVLIGLGIWVYAQRREARAAENLARRDAVSQPVSPGPTGFEDMAATYDRHGMPESAAAYRGLAEMRRGNTRAGH